MRRQFLSTVGVMLIALQPSLGFTNECVILLHGLAKSSHSKNKLEHALINEGFDTVNHDYPSRSASVQRLAQTEIPQAIEACPSNAAIHFVSHSMGGILIRSYLDNNPLDRLGRVVMLAPPNQGSELVDTFQNLPGFQYFGGPASIQLGTLNNSATKSIGPKSIGPKSIGPAKYELGIIAGTRSVNPLLSYFLPEQDDGKVSVARTKLEGAQAHLSVPATHPFIMKNIWVIEETIHFLKHGTFLAGSTRGGPENQSLGAHSQIYTALKSRLWDPYITCEGACYELGIESKSSEVN